MQIKLNVNNEIIEFANYGGISGGIKYNGPVPDDYAEQFKPGLFLYKNGKIVQNANFVEPAMPTTPNAHNQQDEINALLLKEVAVLHTQLGGIDNG